MQPTKKVGFLWCEVLATREEPLPEAEGAWELRQCPVLSMELRLGVCDQAKEGSHANVLSYQWNSGLVFAAVGCIRGVITFNQRHGCLQVAGTIVSVVS